MGFPALNLLFRPFLPHNPRAMEIGGLIIKGKVVLGPMAGVTSLAYREFMKGFGVGLSYSEMISDCGLVYGNKKTLLYAATSKTDRPVGLQLFGFDKDISAKAVAILEENADYDILDLNFGCPVTKVVKTGAGSAWMKDLDKMGEYASAVVKASSKPVTAKIRLGFDEESINASEAVKVLEQAGVKAVSIHCRTRAQGYSGSARYEAIEDLGRKMSVPLIVSGDIFGPLEAEKAVRITGAQAVMVARGGVGNPFVVTQINEYLENGILLQKPTLLQQIGYAEDFSFRLIAEKGEAIAVKELRGLIPHFFSGFPGFKAIRNNIATHVKTKDELFAIFNGLRRREDGR